VDDGIEAERRVRSTRRHVTVLSREGWEAACRQLGAGLHWSARRANFLIEGLDLRDCSGRWLRIGDVLMEVTGRNSPCRRMDEVLPGLLKALGPEWRSGVTARVVSGGRVTLGAVVEWVAVET
jgi:MOSC domain-containing protein YiiM